LVLAVREPQLADLERLEERVLLMEKQFMVVLAVEEIALLVVEVDLMVVVGVLLLL
jgi:hypothetical protein